MASFWRNCKLDQYEVWSATLDYVNLFCWAADCYLQAAYTVGGHSFNAATIEFCLLRSKSTAHRRQLVSTASLSVTNSFALVCIDLHFFGFYSWASNSILVYLQSIFHNRRDHKHLLTPPSMIQTLLMSLHKNKLSEDQSKFGIDHPESLVSFGLCSGTRSSPMVCMIKKDFKKYIMNFRYRFLLIFLKQ